MKALQMKKFVGKKSISDTAIPVQSQIKSRPFVVNSAPQSQELTQKPEKAKKQGFNLAQIPIFPGMRPAIPEMLQPKQAKETLKDLPEVNLAPSSGGQPMPKLVQQKMETSFGTSLANVRIHEGSQNPKKIGALAYTQGENIHFSPGEYQPTTESGQKLLGHEIAHVEQQRAGRVTAPQSKGVAINANPQLETEADVLGAKAARGESAQVTEAASFGVQRMAPQDNVVQCMLPKGKQRAEASSHDGVSEAKRAEINAALDEYFTGILDEDMPKASPKELAEIAGDNSLLSPLAAPKIEELMSSQEPEQAESFTPRGNLTIQEPQASSSSNQSGGKKPQMPKQKDKVDQSLDKAIEQSGALVSEVKKVVAMQPPKKPPQVSSPEQSTTGTPAMQLPLAEEQSSSNSQSQPGGPQLRHRTGYSISRNNTDDTDDTEFKYPISRNNTDDTEFKYPISRNNTDDTEFGYSTSRNNDDIGLLTGSKIIESERTRKNRIRHNQLRQRRIGQNAQVGVTPQPAQQREKKLWSEKEKAPMKRFADAIKQHETYADLTKILGQDSPKTNVDQIYAQNLPANAKNPFTLLKPLPEGIPQEFGNDAAIIGMSRDIAKAAGGLLLIPNSLQQLKTRKKRGDIFEGAGNIVSAVTYNGIVFSQAYRGIQYHINKAPGETTTSGSGALAAVKQGGKLGASIPSITQGGRVGGTSIPFDVGKAGASILTTIPKLITTVETGYEAYQKPYFGGYEYWLSGLKNVADLSKSLGGAVKDIASLANNINVIGAEGTQIYAGGGFAPTAGAILGGIEMIQGADEFRKAYKNYKNPTTRGPENVPSITFKRNQKDRMIRAALDATYGGITLGAGIVAFSVSGPEALLAATVMGASVGAFQIGEWGIRKLKQKMLRDRRIPESDPEQGYELKDIKTSGNKESDKKPHNDNQKMTSATPRDANGLFINQTIGDGNCFFHAVYEAMNNRPSRQADQAMIRQNVIDNLLRNPNLIHNVLGQDYTNQTIGLEIDRLGNGQWTQDHTPGLVATALGLTIVIYNPNGSIYQTINPLNNIPSRQTISMTYTGNHFNSHTNQHLSRTFI